MQVIGETLGAGPGSSLLANRRHSFRNVMTFRNCQRTLPTTKQLRARRFLVALHHRGDVAVRVHPLE